MRTAVLVGRAAEPTFERCRSCGRPTQVNPPAEARCPDCS